MRFCPFCAKENADEVTHCSHCGKRLPAKRPTRSGPVARPDKTPTPAPKTLFGMGALKSPPAEAVRAPEPAKGAPGQPRKLQALEKVAAAEAPLADFPASRPVPQLGDDDGATIPVLRADLTPLPHPQPRLDSRSDPTPPPPERPERKVPSTPPPERKVPSTPPPPPKPSRKASIPPPSGELRRSDSIPLSDEPSATVPSVMVDDPPLESLLPPVAPRPVSKPPPAPGPLVVADPRSFAVIETPPPAILQPLPPELAMLPPMPLAPASPGLFSSVTYLYPVARAYLARRTAQSRVRTMLAGDQRALDGALGELGRAARDARLEAPALREEMRELEQGEQRRAGVEAEALQIGERRGNEVELFAQKEVDAQAAIATQEEMVRKADEELRLIAEQRRTEQQLLSGVDAEIKTLERKAQALEARAAKGPPGDPQAAAAAQEAAQARSLAGGMAPRRAEIPPRIAELEGPLAEKTQAVQAARTELAAARKGLALLAGEKRDALAAFDQRLTHLGSEQQKAAGEISRRFVTIGTLLNLNRVEDDRFTALYARVDELKAALTDREALIARLESERNGFDHAAVQKGLLLVGSGVGVLLVLSLILIIVFH